MILEIGLALAGAGLVIGGIKVFLSTFKAVGSADVNLDETDLLAWQKTELERLRMDYAVAEELGGMDPVTLENMRLRVVSMEENILRTQEQLAAQPVVQPVPQPVKQVEPVSQPVFGIRRPVPVYGIVRKDKNA